MADIISKCIDKMKSVELSDFDEKKFIGPIFLQESKQYAYRFINSLFRLAGQNSDSEKYAKRFLRMNQAKDEFEKHYLVNYGSPTSTNNNLYNDLQKYHDNHLDHYIQIHQIIQQYLLEKTLLVKNIQFFFSFFEICIRYWTHTRVNDARVNDCTDKLPSLRGEDSGRSCQVHP